MSRNKNNVISDKKRARILASVGIVSSESGETPSARVMTEPEVNEMKLSIYSFFDSTKGRYGNEAWVKCHVVAQGIGADLSDTVEVLSRMTKEGAVMNPSGTRYQLTKKFDEAYLNHMIMMEAYDAANGQQRVRG